MARAQMCIPELEVAADIDLLLAQPSQGRACEYYLGTASAQKVVILRCPVLQVQGKTKPFPGGGGRGLMVKVGGLQQGDPSSSV